MSLKLEDEDDEIHLIMCEILGIEEDEVVYFISDDKNHITSSQNKKKIESFLNKTYVGSFDEYNKHKADFKE